MTLSLRERLGSGVLLTARDVAALLNVDRSWVYAHARDLGAIHLGDGPRPRLRFDPTTEKFESFKSSTGAANVRQIHGRKGEVWTPESAADKIVVYRYP